VLNYAKENEHLKTTYKNLFDSINVTRAQTKTITDSLQQKLHDTIYENAKLRAQLFDKAYEQKESTKDTSANTKFANQSTVGKPSLQSLKNKFVVRQPNAFQSERQNISKTRVPPKVVEVNDLSNPVTSNLIPITKESKVVKNDNVIAPGMFRINPSKTYKEDKFMPINQAKASVRTNPITVSQPHVITKKDVNSDLNGLSSIGLDVRNDKSEVVCAMYKQCLITSNHDVYVLKYVIDMNSCGDKHSANVSKTANKRKHKPNGKKPKKIGSKEKLASLKPRKPRTCLRWSPTGRMFDLKGKIITSSESECQYDNSKGDNACTFNPKEPTRKWFPNSTFSLVGSSNLFMVCRLEMLKAYDRNSEASHKFCLEVSGNGSL
ncbi:hypothetical protein Tco_1013063, partial [Tanacetum coccineum]